MIEYVKAAPLPLGCASLVMMAIGEEKKANFIGQWAPTLPILGLYNKVVKLHGSDAETQQEKPLVIS